MRFLDIVVGKEYGVRLKVASGEPLLHVRVLDKVKRTKQVKVVHLGDGHRGMEEFFGYRHFVVPWSERRALVSDEERLEQVVRISSNPPRVLIDAVQFVFEASADDSLYVHGDGHLSASPDALERIMARAGLSGGPTALDDHAFTGRNGKVQAPFGAAERLARAFAAAEPDTVLMEVTRLEDEYTAKGRVPGERHWHEFLRDYRPQLALARQWAGHESEVARLNDEIDRLRGLLDDAIRALRKAGDEATGGPRPGVAWPLTKSLFGPKEVAV